MAQQTALASSLLDRGYQLPRVTKTVERLVSQFNLQRLQAVTSLPAGTQRTRAIEQLCEDASIDMPSARTPQSKDKQTNLPWTKSKKPKWDPYQFQAEAYTLLDGFFSNADGSNAAQINDMRPQSTGVCLMSQKNAKQWTATASTISPDELAILVPGKMEVPSPLTAISLTFPCLNDAKEMVLLHGTMIQMHGPSGFVHFVSGGLG